MHPAQHGRRNLAGRRVACCSHIMGKIVQGDFDSIIRSKRLCYIVTTVATQLMSFDDRLAPMSSWLELWLKLGWKPSQTATRLQVLAVLAARLRPLPDRIESPTVRAKGLKSESQGLEDKGSGVLPLQQCCIV